MSNFVGYKNSCPSYSPWKVNGYRRRPWSTKKKNWLNIVKSNPQDMKRTWQEAVELAADKSEASTCDLMHLWRGLNQGQGHRWLAYKCLLQILGQNIVAYPQKLVYINEKCSATETGYNAKQSKPRRRHTAIMYASAKPSIHTFAHSWWRPLASTKTTYNSRVGRLLFFKLISTFDLWLWKFFQQYTPCPEKRCHFIFACNSAKC